jgi:hypothetical protein
MTAPWSGKCLLWPGLAIAVRDARPTETEGCEPSDEVNPVTRFPVVPVRGRAPHCSNEESAIPEAGAKGP